MLLKDAFNKTAFIKFKISNNFKQNNDETHSKQPKIHRKIHTSHWILKSQEKNPQTKSLETLPNVFDAEKKTISRVWIKKITENLHIAKPRLWIFILCDFCLRS
jgi:hypothetical protein